MKTRFHFLFLFFTLLLLFYPGDSTLFNTFAYNRNLFVPAKSFSRKTIQAFPIIKNQNQPNIQAQGVYVVDLSSFTPIYEKNIHEKFLPASLAKIMTALVAYDIYKPDEVIEVKRTFTDGQSENLQLMGLFQGERITVENLLYGILIHSGNDAAYALADHIGFDKFISLMNQKAIALHMSSSHFKNPAGLDDMDQIGRAHL